MQRASAQRTCKHWGFPKSLKKQTWGMELPLRLDMGSLMLDLLEQPQLHSRQQVRTRNTRVRQAERYLRARRRRCPDQLHLYPSEKNYFF